MRTLVIGDIHGGLKALQQALARARISLADKLIFLGDYVDGWSQSPQVLDYLIELGTVQNCVFIRGNHDALLLKWLKGNHDNPLWNNHGGESTIAAYKSVTDIVRQHHIRFLETLDDFYLDNSNRLFVHAGFTNMNGVHFEYFTKMFYWERTLWETAMAVDKKMERDHPFFPKRLTLYDEVYIGHTPVTRIGKTIPVQMDCVWNMDTGAAFQGPLSVMDVDSKEFWQSDPLPELYPLEKGRNKTAT